MGNGSGRLEQEMQEEVFNLDLCWQVSGSPGAWPGLGCVGWGGGLPGPARTASWPAGAWDAGQGQGLKQPWHREAEWARNCMLPLHWVCCSWAGKELPREQGSLLKMAVGC